MIPCKAVRINMTQDKIAETRARVEAHFAGRMGADLDEVAAFFGTSRPTVRRQIRAGVFESYRDGKHRMITIPSIADRAETLLREAKPPRPLPWQRKMVEKRRKGPRKGVVREALTNRKGV
jgi:excisionase family DNA binding protein